MNATSSVQFRRLQQPEIETGEVTKRHRVAEVVFLKKLALLLSLFFLLQVLLDQSSPIVVEMLKDKCLVQRATHTGSLSCHLALGNLVRVCWKSSQRLDKVYQRGCLPMHGPCGALNQLFLKLLIVLDHFLLIVIEGIKCVVKWYHGLGDDTTSLGLAHIDLDEEGQRDVIKDVLSQAVEGVIGQVFKEF
jgi:hypothetical protein